MRNVPNIEARKIVAPTWHVRQDTAHFSSLHPKNLLTSRSESATETLEPQNFQLAVTRSCKRIDAGFSLPSIHRRRESWPQQCPGLSSCSFELPPPEDSKPSVGVC